VVIGAVSVVLASGQNSISWFSVSKLRRRVSIFSWHEHVPSLRVWWLRKGGAPAAGVQCRIPKTALSLLSATEVNNV
jgi:hypothetical protein